jgi:hypothetical protein
MVMSARFLAKRAAASFVWIVAVGVARADDNDQLLGAINDFCAKPRGNISETVKLALGSPFQAQDAGTSRRPVYVREIHLTNLTGGAIVTLKAKSATAPIGECLFVGYSDDLAALLAHMKIAFALSEPVERPLVYNGWHSSGRVATAGRSAKPAKVELDYSLQDNQKAGSFNLAITR